MIPVPKAAGSTPAGRTNLRTLRVLRLANTKQLAEKTIIAYNRSRYHAESAVVCICHPQRQWIDLC
jgi:hypothetical protein